MVTVCILFVITTTFMIICFGDNEKENKVPKSVHFYVTCYNDNPPSGLELWIGKPKWHRPPGDIFYKWIGYGPVMRLTNASNFGDYNLNVNDFSHMKKGDIEEVNINLEDCCHRQNCIYNDNGRCNMWGDFTMPEDVNKCDNYTEDF